MKPSSLSACLIMHYLQKTSIFEKNFDDFTKKSFFSYSYIFLLIFL